MDYLKLLNEGFTRKYLKESEEIEDTSTDEIDVGDLFMNGDETYKLLDVKIDEDGEVVVEAENDETGEPEEIEYISKEEAEELYGEPDAEDEPEAYAESLYRRIKECLRRINEAQMSPEDEADSAILRDIANKSLKRSNAKLTQEEKDILKKYNLLRDGEGSVRVDLEPDKDSNYYHNSIPIIKNNEWDRRRASRNNFERTGFNNDKINLADIARKIPQRGNDGYRYSNIERDRDAQNAEMQSNYNSMKSNIRDRNYYKQKMDNVDTDYDSQIAELQQKIKRLNKEREDSFGRYSKYTDEYQNRINKLLKKNESLKRLKESWGSNDFKSDIYNALSGVMFKWHQAGYDIEESQLDSALEWFSTHFWDNEYSDIDESYLREDDGHGYYDELGNWVGDEFKKNQVERNTANFFDKTWNGQNSQSTKDMRARQQSVGTKYDPDANPNGQKTPSQGQIKQSQRDVNVRANYYDYQNSRNKSSGYDPDANPNGQKTRMGQGDINQRKNGFTPQNTQQQSQPVQQQTQQSSGNYNPQQNVQPQQQQQVQQAPQQQTQPQQPQQQQQPQGPGAGSPNYNDGQTRVIGLDQTQGMGKYKTPRSK